MAALTPATKDLLFIVGLGLTASALVATVRRMLLFSRDASIIPPSENKPSYITQDVEDSLKLGTLDKLLDSPNFCIQETTAIIICERALHDGTTIDALLWHIAQPNHDLREKGIRALSMMLNSSTVKIINKPSTYAALVKSLEYSVTDYEHNGYDLDWDNWHLRDIAEQGCLMILGQLVDKYGIEGVVKARFVERWLAKEPWGDTDEERFFFFAESLRKNYRLNEITVPLFRDRIGRRQLIKAKLIPHQFEMGTRQRDTRMINGESTAGEDFDGMFVESRRRRDQSAEDDRIRRRNREAMVLNDGTRPLGRDDIIQRDSTFSR
ncbi:uncharacterized protein LY89DRAFT_637146 [Mollisia scopiformis]|uniref:Cytoskeleton-associated protein n=1 Tax=Mollisia scopiformis TaxID=149040 RepID=A0A194XS18_MOLSC|nr:uncharacterized protein LY89DRAFT_637146 [Mollisia scopiformis]KUJ22844.1 hypothetical protein LY89DRAFT_637146 [Mollisia scopiformis]